MIIKEEGAYYSHLNLNIPSFYLLSVHYIIDCQTDTCCRIFS